MEDEPFGHRGRPNHHEQHRASVLKERLGATVSALGTHGFTHAEAVSFLAGIAHEHGARGDGETWFNLNTARFTIQAVLDGHAAKEWSMGLIEHAIEEVQVLI